MLVLPSGFDVTHFYGTRYRPKHLKMKNCKFHIFKYIKKPYWSHNSEIKAQFFLFVPVIIIQFGSEIHGMGFLESLSAGN
jgi:hypothetical protein